MPVKAVCVLNGDVSGTVFFDQKVRLIIDTHFPQSHNLESNGIYWKIIA